MLGRRKLPDPSFNRIFNALSIGVNIRSHFNELILAWSAYKRQAARKIKPIQNDYNLARNLVHNLDMIICCA